MISLDVSEAIGILESIGCDQDPIMRGGIESSLSEIDSCTYPTDRSSKIRIGYWNQKGILVKGSLYSMVKDRLGLQKHVRKRRRAFQPKTYRLYDWGQHGSGIVHFEIINEIESDTRVKFTFPSEAFEDYQILIEAIASQLRDERIRCTTYSEDDVYITIQL